MGILVRFAYLTLTLSYKDRELTSPSFFPLLCKEEERLRQQTGRGGIPSSSEESSVGLHSVLLRSK